MKLKMLLLLAASALSVIVLACSEVVFLRHCRQLRLPLLPLRLCSRHRYRRPHRSRSQARSLLPRHRQ